MNEEPEPVILKSNRKWFKSVIKEFIVAALVIGFIAFWCLPYPTYHPKKSGTVEAINNAKQIGLALFIFQEEYGSYPNDDTAKDFIKNHPTYRKDLSGTSSNALLRQLIISSKNDRSEDMFKLRCKKSVEPDGNIKPGEILKKGECGFVYISGLSTAGNPSRIVILAPLIPGTKKFDPKPFDGKAIGLRIDNSVGIYTINEDGNIYNKGINILSPEYPIWNGKAPDIRYPE